MADITMCSNGEQCPKRMTCYRYMARPNHMQSYASFYRDGKPCDAYYEREYLLSNSGACKECA